MLNQKAFLFVSAFWKQKSMTFITYFLGYHCAKDTPLWLTKRIFSNDLREKLQTTYANVPTIRQYLQQIFLTQDQNLVPTLFCHFLPVRKSSFWKALEHF